MDHEDYTDQPTRSKNRVALNAIINENTVLKSTDYWVARLAEIGVPCGEINNVQQVFENPQVQHLGMARDVDSQERGPAQIVGQPIKMSRSKAEIRRPPPTKGQHTGEILAEFGYSDDDINGFAARGIT
jgi:crotonobetainyl-CoA:carnitine CoA-transferase CaiB-like acyl-CoA transferase